jgi:hypothetical protein
MPNGSANQKEEISYTFNVYRPQENMLRNLLDPGNNYSPGQHFHVVSQLVSVGVVTWYRIFSLQASENTISALRIVFVGSSSELPVCRSGMFHLVINACPHLAMSMFE